VNAKQHINIKELLKKWDSDYTLQQVKVEQFLFYFWFLTVIKSETVTSFKTK
jgi:hypothetical protein